MTTQLVLAAALLSLAPLTARAHCDSLDGPVLKTARTALDANDVSPVLAWVKPGSEQEIRAAFREAVEARKASPGAREASDHRFFETLVRVHRAGEGAEYTGLKPAGGISEALQAADLGVAKKDGSAIEQRLVHAVQAGLRDRFARLTALQPPGSDVAAGRKWVEAYVEYVHYVERLEAALSAPAGHAGAADAHHAHAEPASAPATAARSASHAHAH